MANAWRVAKSLNTLLSQFNAACPKRSKASDGSIGDADHSKRTSDHNPWVGPVGGLWVVTARDFTHDPANGMDIDAITDQLVATRDPRIKYVIANRYILDSRGANAWKWMKYSGSNPHDHHFHLSVMSTSSLFDSTALWNLPMFQNLPTLGPANPPVQPAGVRLLLLTSPYMAGEDVKAVQARLNRDYPSYSKLTADGVFGPATDKVVREFQRRAGLSVDGKIGPATRRALRL